MSQQKPPLIVKLVQVSALQFLTSEFIVTDINERLFNVNCQAQLNENSQLHQNANANSSFSINMLLLSHTVVG